MKPMKPRPAGSAHDALVEAIAAIAIGQGRDREAGPKLAADFLDCSASLLHKATDPDCRETLGFSRVAQLAGHFPGFAVVMARYFARLAGGQFVPRPGSPDRPRAWAELLEETPEDFGRALSDTLRAAQNPAALGLAERSRIARELFAVINDLVGLASPFIEPAPAEPKD